MGPWPILRLRDAIRAHDDETAIRIILELAPGGGDAPDLKWRETAAKIAIQYAGYCDPGPLRPPFVKVPDSVMERVQKRAAYWKTLCDKYRPAAKERATA